MTINHFRSILIIQKLKMRFQQQRRNLILHFSSHFFYHHELSWFQIASRFQQLFFSFSFSFFTLFYATAFFLFSFLLLNSQFSSCFILSFKRESQASTSQLSKCVRIYFNQPFEYKRQIIKAMIIIRIVTSDLFLSNKSNWKL